jgi:hypothetical protein
MSNIATVTVFDGAGTPVVHTFTPVKVSEVNGVITALYRENLAAVPVNACPTLTIVERTLLSGVVETRTRFSVPVMESVGSQNAAGYTAAPKVAYSDANEWVNWAHPRSTITGRRLAKQLLTNFSNNVSTTVAAATSGPFDEAVAQLIMPT